MGVGTSAYPEPIVEHKFARQRAIDTQGGLGRLLGTFASGRLPPWLPPSAHRPPRRRIGIGAGDFVGTFAELGADVTKVEYPERGDVTGIGGPRIAGWSERHRRGQWPQAERPHRPQIPEGQQQFDRLLSSADILLQNTMPASLAGLGLDRSLAERFSLIHIHLQGFMDALERGGYDMVVQAESGFAALNAAPGGSASNAGGSMDVLAATKCGQLCCWPVRARKDGMGAYIETLDASGISALPTGHRTPQAGRTCRWAPCTPDCAMGKRSPAAVGSGCARWQRSPIVARRHPRLVPRQRPACHQSDRVVHRKARPEAGEAHRRQDADGLLKSASTRGVPWAG